MLAVALSADTLSDDSAGEGCHRESRTTLSTGDTIASTGPSDAGELLESVVCERRSLQIRDFPYLFLYSCPWLQSVGPIENSRY